MGVAKTIGLGVGAVMGLAITGAIVKFYVMSPRMRPAADLKAPGDPAAVERGKYLAHSVYGCVGCHSSVHEDMPGEPFHTDKMLLGREFAVFAEFPGRIRAPNLTPDKATGIGDWTDGEIVRAMREGVAKNGRPLFPMMPYPVYSQVMSDSDALDVVAYLRSLPAVQNQVAPLEVGFPISMFVRAAPAPLEKSPPPAPAPSDTLARGKWLLTAGNCDDCHTTKNEKFESLPGMTLAGGNPFPIPGKGTVYTRNITSDKETGIGTWTDEDITNAVFLGKGKDGRALYGMPWPYYQGLTAEDRTALVAALRQVPAVKHAVPANKPQ